MLLSVKLELAVRIGATAVAAWDCQSAISWDCWIRSGYAHIMRITDVELKLLTVKLESFMQT